MKKINLNRMAVDIARKEGKTKEVDIAQIKEVLGIVLDELAQYNLYRVWRLLRSRKKKKTNW